VLFARFDVAAYVAAVQRFRPAVLTLPPAHLRLLMAAGVSAAALAPAALVRSANAPLDPGLRDEFEAHYGIPIMTYYGATEFCGVVSGWPLALFQQRRQAKADSVGLPRPGVAFRIVDDASRPVPPGETGRVEVRAERIGPQWLRTSDYGRLDAEGFLFLGGRSDGAINRGGFKVLPETVAAVLRSHPSVYDAAVIGRPDARLGAVPVAFVELRPGADIPAAGTLLEHARSRLVAYQVPEQVHVLERLPRTSTLKISIADLQRMAEQPPSQDQEGDKA
jgi:long-chain acyl-CoA synthetase